jgi:platelet-activating factor acetylhydrolase
LKYIVGRLTFPAHLNAPLLPSSTKHPLIIFSHGLAGTRTTYTQYCSALASQGYVVLAVEHRDGSAPAVLLPPSAPSPSPSPSLASGSGTTTPKKHQPKDRVLGYIKKDEIEWEEGQEKSLEAFRTLQLEMRVREVYEAFYSFKRISNGDVGKVTFDKMDAAAQSRWVDSVRDKVDLDLIDLTGHSFGAGTIVSLEPRAHRFCHFH